MDMLTRWRTPLAAVILSLLLLPGAVADPQPGPSQPGPVVPFPLPGTTLVAPPLPSPQPQPSASVQGHMAYYAYDPVEHDDQGRSDEPDFASTSIFGFFLGNRVIDLNLDGRAEADSALSNTPPGQAPVLAPGCWDDSGRRPSGLCGAWTAGVGTPLRPRIVPPGTIGVQGMTGGHAPGRFTRTQQDSVRFLDARLQVQLPTGANYELDVNHKLQDAGVLGWIRVVDPRWGSFVVLGPTAWWAWHGVWTDKNGNGVIDHVGNPPTMDPRNEFVWLGNCFMQGSQIPNPGEHCVMKSNPHGGFARMTGYMFPGNHHPGSPDLPASQVIAFALLGMSPDQVEAHDAWVSGDPLLGESWSTAPDMNFDDRTGDTRIENRGWLFGMGGPTMIYDPSIVATITTVTALNCSPDSSRPRLDLRSCAFVDVDRYSTWSPAVESILQGTLKPTLRSNWLFLRDSLSQSRSGADGLLFSKGLYALSRGPDRGDVNDAAVNPGWSREPNHPRDAYAGGLRYGTTCPPEPDARHHGWCNTGYDTYRARARGYNDVVAVMSLAYQYPVSTADTCVLCQGGVLASFDVPGRVNEDGKHERSLAPGQWLFQGFEGRWHDRDQVRDESTINMSTLGLDTRSQIYKADGWVGSVATATGQLRYRGFGFAECVTENGRGSYDEAVCNPYLNGNVDNPQQYGDLSHGEWAGDCDCERTGPVVLTPDGGTWNVPVIVVRNHSRGVRFGESGVEPTVELRLAYHAGPIRLYAMCSLPVQATTGFWQTMDLLILPLGNAGQGITVEQTVRVPADVNGDGEIDREEFDLVTDVDYYAPLPS